MINKAMHPEKDILEIKQMMERSGRFISLSGLSGIAAGLCALVGAYFANDIINSNPTMKYSRNKDLLTNWDNTNPITIQEFMGHRLLHIAILTFIAAFILSFLFTWLRSQKSKLPIWGATSKRLFINVSIPMVVGGVYLLKLIENGTYCFIAPGCLLFYGLALVNASKYTLGEVRYLGYFQILLGFANLWFIGNGLLFWSIGFGWMHIIYGAIMWYKYERLETNND